MFTTADTAVVNCTTEKFLRHETCVSKVPPQRAVLNKKISSPLGSPICSDKRWNVDNGTTISRQQSCACAKRRNGLYSPRQRCMSVKHDN